jgi:hypothetical protein
MATSSTCSNCSAGFATNLTGQASCAACLAGTAAVSGGLSTCTPCAAGTYTCVVLRRTSRATRPCPACRGASSAATGTII